MCVLLESNSLHILYAVPIIQAVIYVGVIAVTRIARPNLSKLCYRSHQDTKFSIFLLRTCLKMAAMWVILAAYIVPFFLIPCTVLILHLVDLT